MDQIDTTERLWTKLKYNVKNRDQIRNLLFYFLSNTFLLLFFSSILISCSLFYFSHISMFFITCCRLPLIIIFFIINFFWIITKYKNHTRVFFNVFDNKVYNFKLPELSGRICIGTSFGWFLSVGIDFHMFGNIIAILNSSL